MKVSNIIKIRRAIYPNQYKKGKIKKTTIEEILKNGNLAPSHRLTQPWFFKIYQNEYKDKLALSLIEHYKSSLGKGGDSKFKQKKILEKCTNSDCIIAIFMNRDLDNSVPEWEEIAATAMAVQNMWLTCVEKKIGCYWSSPKYISKMSKYFSLNQNQRCLGFFYMGLFDHSNQKSKDRVDINQKSEWFV